MPKPGRRSICQNRRAEFEFELDTRYEAGMILTGSEVKSMRAGKVTLEGAWVEFHQGRPVLLNLGVPGSCGIAPWADRVHVVDAKYVGEWELPLLGAVTAPTAVTASELLATTSVGVKKPSDLCGRLTLAAFAFVT